MEHDAMTPPTPAPPPRSSSRGSPMSSRDDAGAAGSATPEPPAGTAAEAGAEAAREGGPAAAAPTSPAAPAPKKRGTVACRRCRRLRTKCIHQGASPPCDACRAAGERAVAECSFPRRGERDVDRQFRRRPPPAATLPPMAMALGGGNAPLTTVSNALVSNGVDHISPGSSSDRTPGRRSSHGSIRIPRTLHPTAALAREDVLPPTSEVVDGCRVFVTSYFQLGFIPKAVFLEQLGRQPGSISTFLLACILSISARFTPALMRRYGGAREATEYFLEAAKQMVPAEMYSPSLDRIKAFFLLAISQWGNGDRDSSSIDMGIAVRMAALLKLHCEESYDLGPDSSAEQVVRSESGRRVFWMIQSQENLHSGYKTPAPFPLEDITTLLPCNEKDFAFGSIPSERAALAGTPPAKANPQLVSSPRRCLFASLIQAHSLWGAVSRKASRADATTRRLPPWDPKSDFQLTAAELNSWEEHLPQKHAFSVWNLRGWKSESLHLAYLAVTMVIRLTNMVARRSFLDEMLMVLSPGSFGEELEPATPTMANANDAGSTRPDTKPTASTFEMHGAAPPGFWANMSAELFDDTWRLHEQIDAYFGMRGAEEGFPQILVFCVYMCGSVSSYLWRYPALCPQLAERAETMSRRSLEALSALHGAWPTSSKWQRGLQASTPQTVVSPAISGSGAPTPKPVNNLEPATAAPPMLPPMMEPRQPGPRTPMATGPAPPPPALYVSPSQSVGQRQTVPGGMLGELVNILPNGGNSQLAARLGDMQAPVMPGEVFDMELSAFMQGDFHFDPLEGWVMQDPMAN